MDRRYENSKKAVDNILYLISSIFQFFNERFVFVAYQALGKTGKVTKIYPDGDMRIQLGGHTWTFNPLSVNLVPPGSDAANSFVEANRGTIY